MLGLEAFRYWALTGRGKGRAYVRDGDVSTTSRSYVPSGKPVDSCRP